MPTANASSIVTISGIATARAPARGEAPGIVPAPWVFEPADNGVFIANFPPAPVSPAWVITETDGVAVVYNYPRYQVQAEPIINVTMTGIGGGRTRFQGRRIVEALESANGGKLIEFRRSE